LGRGLQLELNAGVAGVGVAGAGAAGVEVYEGG